MSDNVNPSIYQGDTLLNNNEKNGDFPKYELIAVTTTKNVSKRYWDGKTKHDVRNSLIFHVVIELEKDEKIYHEYAIDKKNATTISLRCNHNRHGVAEKENTKIHHCAARLSIKLGDKIKTVKREELKRIYDFSEEMSENQNTENQNTENQNTENQNTENLVETE